MRSSSDSDETVLTMSFPLLVKKVSGPAETEHRSSRGVTLAWQDLSVYVENPSEGYFNGGGEKSRPHNHNNKQFKRVINNVSGVVYPGSLMGNTIMYEYKTFISFSFEFTINEREEILSIFIAVLGASGAGKSTLLNVLANRAPGNVIVDGDFRVNGLPAEKSMRQISGFVYQDDLFTETLTVAEHLTFVATLKLDRRLKSWERKRRVEELLVELSLKKCEHTRIGFSGQTGISGGERKRLAFASEIISGCPLLFLDEPTTGLDSFSAQKIVGMMRHMAASGKTIICTIHQPSSQVFAMFDQLCLLAEGRTAYLGSARDAPGFMAELGFLLPQNYNPADFYIKTLAVYPGKESESRRNIRTICDSFASSEVSKSIEEKVHNELKTLDSFSLRSASFSLSASCADTGLSITKNIEKPGWWIQLCWLTWRSFLDATRNPQIHAVRTVQKVIGALLIGFCFFGVTLDQKGIQDIQGVLFIIITESTFPAMYGVLHVFPQELPLFLRENKSGLYKISSYYLSKVISLLPGFIIEPVLFASIAYWIVGLRPTIEAFLITTAIAVLTTNTAAACGCFFSAAFDNVSLAITALIPFDYLLMITGGLFIKLGTLPAYLAWLKFLSWFMYANEAMSVVQWKDVANITCDADPVVPCVQTGADVLANRSFGESHFQLDFFGLISLYIFFHVAAYVALIFRCRRL